MVQVFRLRLRAALFPSLSLRRAPGIARPHHHKKALTWHCQGLKAKMQLRRRLRLPFAEAKQVVFFQQLKKET